VELRGCARNRDPTDFSRFISAKENATEQEFRQQCLQAFTDHKALDFMFDTIKRLSLTNE